MLTWLAEVDEIVLTVLVVVVGCVSRHGNGRSRNCPLNDLLLFVTAAAAAAAIVESNLPIAHVEKTQ